MSSDIDGLAVSCLLESTTTSDTYHTHFEQVYVYPDQVSTSHRAPRYPHDTTPLLSWLSVQLT